MSTYSKVLRGHVTPEDKARSDYAYIPFVLPRTARRLHVRYEYSAQMSSDKVDGGNVIDVGLFDPRGSAFPGGSGFRGWSGSPRDEFTIALNSATPGYLPGPLPEGEYQVILGLYRIWPAGADYEIHVEADLIEDGAATDDAEPVPAPVAQGTMQAEMPVTRPPLNREQPTFWLCGDFQSHTYHSDAKGTPDQLVAKAEALELDFLAITDHNTVSHHAELAALASHGVLLLCGQEVTTYYGHMNVWGTGRWCDFRCRSNEEMAQVIALAHEHGGVCSINHPKRGGPAWEYETDLPVQAMEVWQGPWPHRNGESFALWDRLLNAGRRLPAVGGSDYHCPSGEDTSLLRLGQPTTWVKVTELSEDAILAGICAGRTCISAHRAGPRLDLTAAQGDVRAEMGDVLNVRRGKPIQVNVEMTGGEGYRLDLIADGARVFSADIVEGITEVSAEIVCERYVRAEVVGDASPEQVPDGAPADLDLREWRWAISNPVYVRM